MSSRVVRGLEIGVFPVLWTTKRLLSVPVMWWTRTALALVSASFGYLVWARFFAPHGTLTGTWSGYSNSLAYGVAWLCFIILIQAGPRGLDRLGIALLHRVARMLPVRGQGALAVTRHTLETRDSDNKASFWNRRSEVGGLVAAALLASGLTAAFTIDRAMERQEDALTFTATVVPLDTTQESASSGVGVHRAALDPSVITVLEADPSLAVVPYGRVTVGPTGGVSPQATITLVSVSDLDGVVPAGAGPLGLQDGVMLSPEPESEELAFPAPRQVIDVSTGTGTATLLNRVWSHPLSFATRSWGEAAWGEIPVVGALVAYVGGELPAGERFDYVAAATARAGAEAQVLPTLSAEALAFRQDEDTFTRGYYGVMSAFVVALACFATVLIAVRTVRKHRQVRATVAALGATPRALALAVPIDAGITLAVASAVGAPIGVAAAAVAKVPNLFALGAPFNINAIVNGLWWNLTQISWGPVAGVVGGTWLVAVAATTAYGFAVARRTPVDELRVAIKEGAL
ncbi:hypothetical protein LGT39_02530 [Demequina sp. TTPB684]|uniref:FtsX-like permease family protein n=1 Tax=unclassified Demequina TaxID=2620311 RepID=UPI001CF446AB|nr:MULTISPECIES: FtsX-like permease family protein [unclassified Demequina]MCB2411724.1 hypothetical protein [Demequina sp. TTPB684]UPU87631.1 hypothetical protein LGT36_010255 [Demequina sp. TMPB413]